MTTVTMIKELPDTGVSSQCLVKKDGKYYVVSTSRLARETLVFNSDADGIVTDFAEIRGVGGRFMTRAQTIEDLAGISNSITLATIEHGRKFR